MRLITTHTVLGLRLMIYLAATVKRRRTNTTEIARRCKVSRHHAAKVIGRLNQLGYLKTRRGSNGGVSLNRDPKSVPLGDLMSNLERRRTLNHRSTAFQCLNADYLLEMLICSGIVAFFSQLNRITLADLAQNPELWEDNGGLL